MPTIQSRCFLINLLENTESVSGLSEEDKMLLSHLSPKEILEIAEKKGKTKEEAVEWSREVIQQLQQELHEESNHETIQQYSHLLKKLLKIHQIVSTTNISPRMTIESTLLSIKE